VLKKHPMQAGATRKGFLEVVLHLGSKASIGKGMELTQGRRREEADFVFFLWRYWDLNSGP
jgi:hypothetical protein